MNPQEGKVCDGFQDFQDLCFQLQFLVEYLRNKNLFPNLTNFKTKQTADS